MRIGNRSIGGHSPVDTLRDQMMMFVRRLRYESTVDAQSWTLLALLASIDRLGDDASPTELAKEMEVRSSNIAAALRDAERRGFLERAPDPQDRRRARLLLTSQGRDTLESARTQRSRWLSSVVEQLTDDDRRMLFLAGKLFERLATVPTSAGDRP